MDSYKWKENNRTVFKKKQLCISDPWKGKRMALWNYKTKASKNEIKQVAMKKNHFKILAIRWHWNFKTQ